MSEVVVHMEPAEKVDLWRQRYFEAQAAAEEFVLGSYGGDGLRGWIDENARITAQLLKSQRPEESSVTDHFMGRLQKQLLLYDSDVVMEDEPGGTVLRNRTCGILRYRKEAARDGVVLTFKSPCPYCKSLNLAIAADYVAGEAEVACELSSSGCIWKAVDTSGGCESAAAD